MQESLPLILDSGGGGGAKIARASVIDMPTALGNLNDLSQSLTIGGTAFAPCAYLVADDINQTTGAWASRHDASKVLSVTGTGDEPTYGNVTAITNNAVKYAAAKYHIAADTTWGQSSNKDGAFECVFRVPTIATQTIVTNYVSNKGFRLVTDGTGYLVFQMRDGVGSIVQIYNNPIVANVLYHVFVGIDRSEKAYIYLNGVIATGVPSADITGITGTWLSDVLKVGWGCDPQVCTANIWDLTTNPWPGAATNQAVMGAIAAERFAKVAGIYDRKSTVYSFARTTSAYLDRYVSAGVRQLFPVSVNWPRVCERVDNASVTDTGYLGEVQATNLCLRSEELGTAWTAEALTSISTDAIVAPDGTMTADGVIGDVSNAAHGVFQTLTLPATLHCVSTFAKKGNVNWCMFYSNTTNVTCFFDLANGVVGTAGAGIIASGITNHGNGWYRCYALFTGAASAKSIALYSALADNDVSFSGDTTTINTYFWGVQVEAVTDHIPSSYIKTLAAAATRTKDSLVRTVAVTTGKLSTSCNVFLGTTHDNAAAKTLIAIDDASANNFVDQTVSAGDVSVLNVTTGGSALAAVTGTQDITNGAWHAMAAKVKTNYAAQTVDGTVDGTPDTALTTAANYTAVRIGCSGTGLTQQPNGLISKIKVYKDVL